MFSGLVSRFTPRATPAMADAEAEARRRGQATVTDQHLLLSLLDDVESRRGCWPYVGSGAR